MRVLLVSSNTERINMVTMPLGLGLVAAACRRAGHEVHFVDLLDAEDPIAALTEAIAAFQPQAIGISVRNIDDQNCAAPRFLLEQVRPVVQACKQASGAPVVLGGAGYSIFPDAALSFLGADFGVRGEGEVALVSLLERLETGSDPGLVPGVHVRGRPGALPACYVDTLDCLPSWDDALMHYAAKASEDLWVPMQSRRGCPNDCSYCSTASVQGRAIRSRTARATAETVARLQAAGFGKFYFVDNSFNLPERHGRELCEWMTRLCPGVQWRAILYPQRVSEELVAAMAASGCVEVALGFESGNPDILRAMNKRFTPEDITQASRLLKAYGIRRNGFLLLGGPGETRDTADQSLQFAQSLALDFLKVTVGIRVYPDTPLAACALRDGMIEAGDTLLHPRFYLSPALGDWRPNA